MDKVCYKEIGVVLKDNLKDILSLIKTVFNHISSQGHSIGQFVLDSHLALKRHFYRTFSILEGRGTYYIAGKLLTTQGIESTTQAEALITHGQGTITHGEELTTHGDRLTTNGNVTKANLPHDLRAEVNQIGIRASKENLKECIIKLCRWRELTASELSVILDKGENHIRREYLKPLIDQGKIKYKFPDMVKHPDQAYQTVVG